MYKSSKKRLVKAAERNNDEAKCRLCEGWKGPEKVQSVIVPFVWGNCFVLGVNDHETYTK